MCTSCDLGLGPHAFHGCIVANDTFKTNKQIVFVTTIDSVFSLQSNFRVHLYDLNIEGF